MPKSKLVRGLTTIGLRLLAGMFHILLTFVAFAVAIAVGGFAALPEVKNNFGLVTTDPMAFVGAVGWVAAWVSLVLIPLNELVKEISSLVYKMLVRLFFGPRVDVDVDISLTRSNEG